MILITVININLESLIPVIFEFKEKIDTHLIFFDSSAIEKKLARRLKKSIEKINRKYSLNQTIELFEIDEDSKKDINFLQKKLETYNKPLYLNASGSDTSLLVILSGFILNKSGYVLAYDKLENSYNKISKKNFSNHLIKNCLNLNDFITLMGYKLISQKMPDKISSYEKNLNYVFKNINTFFNYEYLIKRGKIKEIDSKFQKALNALNYKKERFGALFEYFIYFKLAKYNFDDIKLSAVISFDENIENEFDILAIKNNHIYAIECKLGTSSEAQSVIYKLDSIIENFGEDSKGLIVNIHSFENRYKNSYFINKIYSQGAKKRANYNNLEVYNDYIFNEIAFNEILERFFEVKSKETKNLKNEPIFLLGGSDLEMQEIKKLLIKHNKHYIDKKLSWGAKLSDYINIIDKNGIYFGIELIEDVAPPQNYIAIDHHNDLQNKPSSLEQVADILNTKLNRYQQLVALNDKGYIPAMQEFGATEVEIDLIRQKDREAQGVTKQDEILAKLSLENRKKEGTILIIKALTDKFSPIIDRCYQKEENVLIYNSKKLTYYGKGVEKLVKLFKNEIKNQQAYYGGNYGFFGISENVFDKKNLKEIRKKIINTLK